MNYFYVQPVVFFVIGIIVGSFLHLCAYRVPRGESILFPPSHCPHCTRRVKAVDLVPLLNYIWLKGRCRFCNGRISISHPLIELLTGLLFSIAYLRFASVYQAFDSLDDFEAAVTLLRTERDAAAASPGGMQ